jgi:uncharacterized protein (TIGR02444 family)
MMKIDTEKQGDELWDYACALYAQSNVEEACLALQNNFKADVNVLLFICWYIENIGSDVSKEFLQSIIKTSLQWQRDVVEPLRQLRKKIGALEGVDARTIKVSMLRSELEAEKSEQFALLEMMPSIDIKAASLPSDIDRSQMARAAYYLYFEMILEKNNVKLDRAAKTNIDEIIKQAFS